MKAGDEQDLSLRSRIYRDKQRLSCSPHPPTHRAQGRGGIGRGHYLGLRIREHLGARDHLGGDDKVSAKRSSEPLSRAPVPEGFCAVRSPWTSGTAVTWCRSTTGKFVTEEGGGAAC